MAFYAAKYEKIIDIIYENRIVISAVFALPEDILYNIMWVINGTCEQTVNLIY